ncbi:MAG: trypsin-like serine protease [Nocardioides sp.]|nr:trypsin-like serine protease [Nocardioides sp.]
MRTRIFALLASGLMAIGLTGAPAGASTGGTPDGEAHPNVALILYYAEDGGRYRCSAALVDEDVLLTAAHCTDGAIGSVLVTFESVIAEEAPSGFPVAADPSVGYTDAELAAAGYLSGTSYTHPAYSDFTDMDNWNDVGVVQLDEPVGGIAPAPIAELGRLDQIEKSQLRKTLFTAVGYGTEVRKPESGPQKPTPMSYPLIRRNVQMPGQKLTPQILQTNGNEHDPFGTGGTCFGDSGGPVFLDGEIVAVTSYGYTSNCRYLGGYQRVDIAIAQDWVNTFLD